MTERDTQRAKVYAAEDFVRTMFDRAAERGNGVVDFFGTALTLPPEARFATLDAVRRYLDQVLALPGVTSRWPGTSPVVVRARRGLAAAHYEADTATMAVPDRHATWALRELVVLHELAHHLSTEGAAHGKEFVTTFCELAGAVMGPESEHVLRVVYAQEGVL